MQEYPSGYFYFRASAAATAGALSSAGTWTNGSDRVLKKEIVDTQYGLDSVLKMRPVDYRMRSNNEKQVGFIAQEMKKIIPEVVVGEEGKMGISYGNLAAVLTKAIQDIYGEFKALETKVNSLEDKDAAKDRTLASVHKVENAQLKANDAAKAKEIADLKARLEKIEKVLNSK